MFRLLRKILGIEENKYKPHIAGKYKPRIYNPDTYKVDENDFNFCDDHDFALDPEYSSLSCNVCHNDND